MKKIYALFLGFIASFVTLFNAQTYQLTGNPVNTTGWTVVPSSSVNGNFIQLTPDVTNSSGAIKLNDPMNLKFCDKWKVEFDFKIDGSNSSPAYYGDGFAFWYLANPPITSQQGSGLGIPQNAVGLMVGFDLYNNSTAAQQSKVHIAYGLVQNTDDTNNIEYFNTPGSSFHSANLNPTTPFVTPNAFRHVEVTGQVNPSSPDSWIITLTIDGVQIVSQSFAPSGGAIGMPQGYFGFSASTGAAKARHAIQNVKIYVDKVPLLQTTVTPTTTCADPITGIVSADLTTFNSQFVANPSNYQFTYVVAGTTTPIANPTNFQFTTPTTVNVIVKDPTGILCDNGDGKIVLTPQTVEKFDVTIKGCPVNGTAVFDLTSAVVTNLPNVTKKYYPTLNDLLNGTAEITNPVAYTSAQGATVYVKIITSSGCYGIAKILLSFNPVPTVKDATLHSCANENNPSLGTFNLVSANVTSDGGITKKFYVSYTDALNETNEIPNPANYIAPNITVYVKVFNSSGCGSISKIVLNVIPQKFSTLLKDKTICIESRTTLDAGPGFTSYLWSTGATTQSISLVTVGKYWVILKNGECWVKQEVNVYPASSPVVQSVDISFRKVVLHVEGGTPDYLYSADGVSWQSSNVFENVTTGDHTFYVKDQYNCDPIAITITVPNISNIITPNGDGKNDVIDFSMLRDKKNFRFDVFNRYGTKVFNGDYKSYFIWDGTQNGRKLPTGTYWYILKWDEPTQFTSAIKYEGWIMLKNRE